MIKFNKMLAMMLTLNAMDIHADLDKKKTQKYIEPKETDEERKKRLDKEKIKQYKAQGLTQFFYGRNSLWALNQKSADKKAEKLNWL